MANITSINYTIFVNYIRTILANLRKADKDFSLIDEGDKILVGVSGGKDSLALIRALSIYSKFAKKNFIVQPVFLDLGFGNADLEGIKTFIKGLGLELYVEDSRFVYDVLKTHQKPGGHLPCSICSRMKKAAMNNVAKRLHFNKVAFAHHNDDAIETLFMNMIHGGRVATFEPKMYLERSKITFIRPLIYCKESDLSNLCEEENIPVLKSSCPADKHTDREEMKNMLRSVYKKYPESYENFRNMLTNYEKAHLYFPNLEYECEDNNIYTLKPVIFADEMRTSSFASKKKKEGEKNYLILKNHLKVGEISFRPLSSHKVAFFGLKGEKEGKIAAVNHLISMISKKINPITFFIYGDKSTAEKCGFNKKIDPTTSKSNYTKKIEK